MPAALVVDDSRTIRVILGSILREFGFDVASAANGREGLAEAERLLPGLALVMIDWNMPEMNGLELVRALRADPRFGATQLVMVTTETDVARMAEAVRAGADEYVMKPFTREVIAEKLSLLGVAA
jgi:two-component system chemotaxis response regulator CheY